MHVNEPVSACMYCVAGAYFPRILTCLRAHTRHHKPPLRGGSASGRRGLGSRGAPPPPARKISEFSIFVLTALFAFSKGTPLSEGFGTLDSFFAPVVGLCPSLACGVYCAVVCLQHGIFVRRLNEQEWMLTYSPSKAHTHGFRKVVSTAFENVDRLRRLRRL